MDTSQPLPPLDEVKNVIRNNFPDLTKKMRHNFFLAWKNHLNSPGYDEHLWHFNYHPDEILFYWLTQSEKFIIEWLIKNYYGWEMNHLIERSPLTEAEKTNVSGSLAGEVVFKVSKKIKIFLSII